jgi:hypothetical protein
MPRQMPRYDLTFQQEVDGLLTLVDASEALRDDPAHGRSNRTRLTLARLQAIYELAYLKMFTRWEVFLECALLRYLCGYQSRHGWPAIHSRPTYFPTIADADAALKQGRSYLLWHNPQQVIPRSQNHLTACPVETILSAGTAQITACSNIRHHIAHAQADARIKFDTATMNFAAQRYPGSNAGLFLRDMNNAVNPPVRYIRHLAQLLCALASQIT